MKNTAKDKVNRMKKHMMRPWSDKELEILYALKEDGLPYRVIAAELKRTINSCEKKYRSTRWEDCSFYDSTRHRMKESFKKDNLNRITKAHNTKLNSEKFRSEIIADKIAQSVEALPTVKKSFYTGPNKKNKHKYSTEDVGLMFSDAHVGHHHTLEETGGLSEYNSDIFKKRIEVLKKSTEEIVELHSNLYKLPTLHIFSLGDIVAGMNNSGNWSPIYINMPIYDQMVVGFEAISDMIYYWLGLFDNIKFYGVMGNHGRCLSELTRILTVDGYKYYNELKEGDLVGTINPDTHVFEFQPIRKIHIYHNEKELISFKNKSFDMDVTFDHSFLYRSRKTRNLNKKSAKELLKNTNTQYYVPSSTYSVNDDYDISDNLLKLIGFIMTDGSYSKRSCNITLYQSKENILEEITNLLNEMNIKYSTRNRNREIKSISNVMVKTAKTSHELLLLSSDVVKQIRKILPKRESIPSWMYKLSDRQVRILLGGIILGDGVVRKPRESKDGYKRKGGFDVVWGKKDFLESLMGLLVSHGISCSINEHKRKTGRTGNYYLQLKESKNYSITSKDVYVKEYNDKVWCVTVDNGTIAVLSENGRPYFTGNSAPAGFEKEYVNWDYMCYNFLEARFKDNPRVSFVCPKTWWILTEIRNHKFLLVHGDDVRSGSVPIQGLMKYEEKMIGIIKEVPDYTLAGHFHNAAELTTSHGRLILNGSFVGPDMYSLKNLQRGGIPEQKIFGIHDKRGITWSYNLNLNQGN